MRIKLSSKVRALAQGGAVHHLEWVVYHLEGRATHHLEGGSDVG